MATTEEYKDGGSASYTFSIEKIKDEDIKVSVDGTDLNYTATNPPAQTTEYTVNGSNVIFKQASVSGSATGGVRIYRETALENADSATFVAGSSIRAADLNANHKLVRFSAQEKNQKIVTDDIRDSQVTSAKILDGTIVDADINASANIQGSKILNDSLTLDKLGAGALPTDITVASANIVDETIVDGDINANANIQGTKLLNDSVPLTKFGAGALPTDITVASANIVDGTIDTADLKNSAVTQNKLDDNSVGTPELINGSVTDAKIETGTLDNRYFTETELSPTANTGQNVLDARYYTETEADARFYNLASAEEIQSGETWVAADNKVATTSAIDARIIDLVDDVGGFHPIPNETSFPSVNVDVNDGAGTLISIKEIVTARTPSSGTVTITDGAGTGNDVLINGCGSTVLPAGFGVIVETTTTLHTYTFHRLTPKATEVTTVAGNIDNVNTTADSIGNVNIVGPDIDNVNTVAGYIGNVNTVAGSISSVNNASTNISSINNFGDLYQVNASNPSTDGGGASLAEGDLYFNTSANRLKVYTGTDWVDGVIASGGGAQTSGDTFTGDIKLNDNVKLLVGTHSDLQIYHNGNNNSSFIDNTTGDLTIRGGGSDIIINPVNTETAIYAIANGKVQLRYDNSTKLETAADGIIASGAIKTNAATSTAGSADQATLDYNSGNLRLLSWKGTGASSASIFTKPNNGSFTEWFRVEGDGGIKLPVDNQKLYFGTGHDLQIYHDGTHSYLEATGGTGNTIIKTGVNALVSNGANVIFKSADNSTSILTGAANGAVTAYYNGSKKFETTSSGATVTGALSTGNITVSGAFPAITLTDTDNNPDYILYNANGHFRIWDDTNNASRLSVNTSGDVEIGSNLQISNDDKKIQIGASQDLELYHASGNSIISNSTGYLEINANAATWLKTTQLNVIDNDATHYHLRTFKDGGVELYHNNIKQVQTTADGVGFINNCTFSDNKKIQMGGGNDLVIYHNGSHSVIQNDTGTLFTLSDNISFKNNANSETLATFTADGAVELYYDNSKKFETTSIGCKITDAGTTTALQFANDNGANGYVFANSTDEIGFKDSATHWLLRAIKDGAVELYHDNSKKFETTSNGARIHGIGYVQAANDADSIIALYADLGDDNDDKWRLKSTAAGSNFTVDNYASGAWETNLKAIGNGAVELYHDNSKKLETTATGATVTGQLEADTFGNIKLADPFIEMTQTITTSRTISNNHNAFTVGPVTINTGVTVTVGDGENWVIV